MIIQSNTEAVLREKNKWTTVKFNRDTKDPKDARRNFKALTSDKHKTHNHWLRDDIDEHEREVGVIPMTPRDKLGCASTAKISSPGAPTSAYTTIQPRRPKTGGRGPSAILSARLNSGGGRVRYGESAEFSEADQFAALQFR
jgi:hypothetical protein